MSGQDAAEKDQNLGPGRGDGGSGFRDGRADSEDHPVRVQGQHSADHRPQTQHHPRLRQVSVAQCIIQPGAVVTLILLVSHSAIVTGQIVTSGADLGEGRQGYSLRGLPQKRDKYMLQFPTSQKLLILFPTFFFGPNFYGWRKCDEEVSA